MFATHSWSTLTVTAFLTKEKPSGFGFIYVEDEAGANAILASEHSIKNSAVFLFLSRSTSNRHSTENKLGQKLTLSNVEKYLLVGFPKTSRMTSLRSTSLVLVSFRSAMSSKMLSLEKQEVSGSSYLVPRKGLKPFWMLPITLSKGRKSISSPLKREMMNKVKRSKRRCFEGESKTKRSKSGNQR